VAHGLLITVDMTVWPGRRIGDLILLRRLARGGMGSIWVAEDLTLEREVAVKFLADMPDDPLAAERFAREAEIISSIDSPYVPRVFGHGVTDEGTPFISMEIVPGVELVEWFDKLGPMNARTVMSLVDQLSMALTKAHERGVVHRDVKPENVIVSGSPEHFHAKLIDFGIAKSMTPSTRTRRLTRAGAVIGTPSYMSPEQLLSSTDVDARSDLWSLAVLVYRALTGQFPFEGETFAAVCMSIHGGRFTPVSTLRPDLPPAIDAWFDKALAVNAARRFESAADLSRSLHEAIAASDVAVSSVELGSVATSRRSRESSFGLARSHWSIHRLSIATRGRRMPMLVGTVLGVALVATAGFALTPRASTGSEARAVESVRSEVGPGLPLAPTAATPSPPEAVAAPDQGVTSRREALSAPPPPLPVHAVHQDPGITAPTVHHRARTVSAGRPRAVAKPVATQTSVDSAPSSSPLTASTDAGAPLVVVTADAAAPPPTIAADAGSDWHPSDLLGEP
jgi:eukaryotic-like serine/threonine-protein kinase